MTDLRADDDAYPAAALVAAERPTPRDVAEMAALLGWLPSEPYLNPAVPA